jgi:hypothetical protein
MKCLSCVADILVINEQSKSSKEPATLTPFVFLSFILTVDLRKCLNPRFVCLHFMIFFFEISTHKQILTKILSKEKLLRNSS